MVNRVKIYFQIKGVNDEWFTIIAPNSISEIRAGRNIVETISLDKIPPSKDRFRVVFDFSEQITVGARIDLVD